MASCRPSMECSGALAYFFLGEKQKHIKFMVSVNAAEGKRILCDRKYQYTH